MKFLLVFLCGIVVSCMTACGNETKKEIDNTIEPETNNLSNSYSDYDNVFSSYYDAQSMRAFKMFKKPIFEKNLDSRTDYKYDSPMWNYDSFTSYSILNENLEPTEQSAELYCCSFSDNNKAFGFFVMEYDGDGIKNLDIVETLHLYDLRDEMEKVIDYMKENNINLNFVSAFRARIRYADHNEEVIIFNSDDGEKYIWYLDSSTGEKI